MSITLKYYGHLFNRVVNKTMLKHPLSLIIVILWKYFNRIVNKIMLKHPISPIIVYTKGIFLTELLIGPS